MEEKIGDILRRILKQSGHEHVYFVGILKNRWEEIVGEFLSQSTLPDRINNNILYIQCFNAAIKQEIFFLKEKIVKKINSFFNENIVEDIRVFFKWR